MFSVRVAIIPSNLPRRLLMLSVCAVSSQARV
jgi:hypothetical protein